MIRRGAPSGSLRTSFTQKAFLAWVRDGGARGWATENPDVVLMDVRLAGASDGIKTAQKMQAQQRVDVVFVTASGDPRTRARAAAAQPAGFILKPFSSEELLNAVATAERRHRNRG